ncbi:hypothetical protein Rsub_08637 [Raphidocelis subcapitata]|uniref:Protein phosphatase n=1 Tax=Raphidocelis subcapitata TaxID=307507 RepID=A0A2V0PEY8_9CHLO|nr:hypothetical protein Rsub_08637 [Raphidocelis subcapitata]|eukprot:GBF95655.1 hypothetical protein Rsub_08637 [Raphidocelis subcapitata]
MQWLVLSDVIAGGGAVDAPKRAQLQRRRGGRKLKRESAKTKAKAAALERAAALELGGARDQMIMPLPPAQPHGANGAAPQPQPLCCPDNARRLAAQLGLSQLSSVPLSCNASLASSPCNSGPLPVIALAGSSSAPDSPVAADGGSVCSSVVSSSSGGESSSGAANRPPRRAGPLAAKGSCLSVSSLSGGDGGRALEADSASSRAPRAAQGPAPARARPAPSPFAAVAALPPLELSELRLTPLQTSASAPSLGVDAPAAAAAPPAISPAKARLIAQLRRRQSERELEAAAAAAGEALCTGPPLPPAERGLVLVSGGSVIPHVAKAATGGEDAYFVTDAGHGALGVADGVSSWAADGVNPGDYSRSLVQNLRDLMERMPSSSAPGTRPPFEGRAVLRRAQMATHKQGSATVILAALRRRPAGARPRPSAADDPDDDAAAAEAAARAEDARGVASYDLHVASLGDCGVRVVRDGKVVLATRPQVHDFNLPFQMSHPAIVPNTDTADSADRYLIEVQEGDVVIAGSDGLFDNVWEDQLLSVLAEALDPSKPTRAAASPPPAEPQPRLKRSSSSFLFSRRSRDALCDAGDCGASAAAPPPPPSGGSKLFGRLRRGGGSASCSDLRLVSSRSTASLCELMDPPSEDGSSPPPSVDACVSISSERSRSVPAAGAAALDAAIAAAAADAPPPTRAQLAQRAADALSRTAHRNAQNEHFKSPWSVAAGRQGLMAKLFAKGGKMDDCTCVVAVVAAAGTADDAPAAGARAPSC